MTTFHTIIWIAGILAFFAIGVFANVKHYASKMAELRRKLEQSDAEEREKLNPWK